MRVSTSVKESRIEIAAKEIPVIPLRSQVVFPGASVAFDVGREMSVAATNLAEKGNQYVFLVMQRDAVKDNLNEEDFYEIGTVSRIKQISRLPGERIRVYAEGLFRARAIAYRREPDCFFSIVEELFAVHGEDGEYEEASLRAAKGLVKEIADCDGRISKEVENTLASIRDADIYINFGAHYLRLREPRKQEILEETFLPKRMELFLSALAEELEITKLERKIGEDVKKNIEKSQREYYLREQMKAIHKELGDNEEECEILREKILKKNMPQEAQEKALAELKRMDRMSATSPEYTVIRNYLDWILELPWTEKTADEANLQEVERVLGEDHYGLETVKERVVEYLAVYLLTKSLKSPILCLVGPPGVGKTSIAKSIARAFGRKFVRMSLGGLKDEAEIRGHRRTYIGSMPGRIVYELKNAGSCNPVFLLDEIDKISSDLRGDPASALLEVLDPEQNATFRDRYLEVSYDLSNVMFIATANSLDTIPAPLRDRMEIIELSGYTPQEKEEIAKRYLVPKQVKNNGLDPKKISFSDGAISEIIDGYTREAGVRSLEREIGSVCRKAAVRTLKETGGRKITVARKSVEEFLGAKRYFRKKQTLKKKVGAVTGLAWTAVGGTTLNVEVCVYAGKGEIVLTGQLGDVMKESARAALSYLRANADKYGIDPADFESKDIHIHFPDGATPKDGPSAGITMASAILSALTGQAARGDIAMTGEITLRGEVLPIGGLKEKSLAADRAGIYEIIIPEENKKDLEEIPAAVRDKLRFFPVKSVDEVFSLAFEGGNG